MGEVHVHVGMAVYKRVVGITGTSLCITFQTRVLRAHTPRALHLHYQHMMSMTFTYMYMPMSRKHNVICIMHSGHG